MGLRRCPTPSPRWTRSRPTSSNPRRRRRTSSEGWALFFGIFNLAKVMDKPSTQPFADKTFPFDGLKTELGK